VCISVDGGSLTAVCGRAVHASLRSQRSTGRWTVRVTEEDGPRATGGACPGAGQRGATHRDPGRVGFRDAHSRRAGRTVGPRPLLGNDCRPRGPVQSTPVSDRL